MDTKKVAVLGAGWLGLPLIRSLSAAGTVVHGSYRREAGYAGLEDAGALPFLLDLPDLRSSLGDFLNGVDALVITLPPGGRRYGERAEEVYLSALESLQRMLGGLHVIYTSSTGIYGSAVTGVVTEATPPNPDTPSGRAVVAAEQWLRTQTDRLTVLRLSGLFGPDRDPTTFFRHTSLIPQGDAPVNMVHLDDVLRAIRLLLATGATGIFNVSAAAHPPKKQFYATLLERAGLPPKSYQPGGGNGKRIDSARLRALGWTPVHDNLIP